MPTTSEFLLAIFQVLATQPEIALSTRNHETVRSAVAEGFGFSVLNMWPTKPAGEDSGLVVRRPNTDSLPGPQLVVADVYGVRKPPFIEAFIAATQDHFASYGRAAYAGENE